MSNTTFLSAINKQFSQYKALAEGAMMQVDDEALHRCAAGDNNSISIIVQHMHGNMLSRFTNLLTEDGEKPWRRRDEEFESQNLTRSDLMNRWNEGWAQVFGALESLTEADLAHAIAIRGEAMTAMDGVLRQIAHYAYHVGQIVLLCKLNVQGEWKSLSIPRGGTAAYNEALLFAQASVGSNR